LILSGNVTPNDKRKRRHIPGTETGFENNRADLTFAGDCENSRLSSISRRRGFICELNRENRAD
jgi:hypothetical protein